MRHNLMTGALFAAVVAFSTSAAYADSTIDLSKMQLNGGATASANNLNIGNGSQFSAMSAFLKTAYDTSGLSSFSGSFNATLQSVGGQQADGFSFMVQGNSPTVTGGNGGNIGAYSISNVLGIGFQSWDNNAAFLFTRDNFQTAAHDARGNFSLGNNLINSLSVTFSYAHDLFSFVAKNATTGQTISDTLSFDVASLGKNVYFGFTGGTGGASAIQSISNFKMNVNNVAVPGPEAGTGLAGLAMAGVGFWAYRRKQQAVAA